MPDQHHEGMSRRDRLTTLVMDHMERRPDRREATDDWGGMLGTVLDRLQDAWTDAVIEEDGDTQYAALDGMNRLVGDVAVVVHEIAWGMVGEGTPILDTVYRPMASRAVARFHELTHEHQLDWWRTNPELYLAVDAIAREYWARQDA